MKHNEDYQGRSRAIELAQSLDEGTAWESIPVREATNPENAQIPSTIFLSSGGSSGAPHFTKVSLRELRVNCRFHGQGYSACGISQGDVVATWGVSGLLDSEYMVYLALSETGATILPLSGGLPPSTIVALVRSFKATSLLVLPSDLVPVCDELRQSRTVLDHVRLVVTGGEPLRAVDMRLCQDSFSKNVRFRSVFQTSDTGTIGFQCDDCPHSVYHIHDKLQYVEIVDIDKDGIGDLVVTNLFRRVHPVIRTRTGDRASFVLEPCACGAPGRRIHLQGRSGLWLKFGGEKFSTSWLTDLRDAIGCETDDFLVLVEREHGLDQLTIYSDRASNDPAVQAATVDFLYDVAPKFERQVASGSVSAVRFAPRFFGSEKIGASGKARTYLDLRQQ